MLHRVFLSLRKELSASASRLNLATLGAKEQRLIVHAIPPRSSPPIHPRTAPRYSISVNTYPLPVLWTSFVRRTQLV